MLLLNETVGIDRDVEAEWLIWIRDVHIPAVLNTGMFDSAKIYKVLEASSEETISYSLQFFAHSLEHVEQYLDVFAPRLVEDHRQRFLNRHVVFRTLLEEV